MDALKKYQVVDNTANKIIKEFESKENAKEYINTILRFEYKRFLTREEDADKDFVDFWRWFYLYKKGKKRNCKLYTIKTITI